MICDRLSITPNIEIAALDHQVDYRSCNNTYLSPNVTSAYGVPQFENPDMTMVPVGLNLNTGAKNTTGQVSQLDFGQFLGNAGVVYISDSRVDDKKYLNFGVDV